MMNSTYYIEVVFCFCFLFVLAVVLANKDALYRVSQKNRTATINIT